MKLLFTCIIAFFVIHNSYSQIKKSLKKEIPDSINMAAIILIEGWHLIALLPNGQIYISNKAIKNDKMVKTSAMLYYPIFTDVDKHTYKNVLVKASIIFDCDNGMHKIYSRKFYFNFSELFDSEENTNAEFTPVRNNSVWINELTYSCNLYK